MLGRQSCQIVGSFSQAVGQPGSQAVSQAVRPDGVSSQIASQAELVVWHADALVEHVVVISHEQ